MDNQSFVEQLTNYFSLTAKVIEEVKKFTDPMTDQDRDAIWHRMKLYVSPSKRIGVSDIWEVCRNLNIPSGTAKHIYFPSMNVTCEACGKEYKWKQVVTKEDEEFGVHERCPACKFPYYDTWQEKQYNKGGNDNGREYNKYVERFRRTTGVGNKATAEEAIAKVKEKLGIRGNHD